MRHTRRVLTLSVALWVFLLLPLACFGQLDEITLGLEQRKKIFSSHARVEGSAANRFAEEIFGQLLGTSIRRLGPDLPYEVTIVNDLTINAFSTAGGKVYLNLGMIPILSTDPGVWAAVLGHEIGHTLGRHHYKTYLRSLEQQKQQAYYRARIAAGDESAYWGLLGTQIGGLISLKLSRNEEHEADYLGLMMMAEAGYHPDFALTMQRRLRHRAGDRSKIATFFSSDHPRWASREKRTVKSYDQALGLFQSRWPDPSVPPGGTPPPIATLGTITASRDKKGKAVLLHIPLNIRNAKGTPITVAAIFKKGKQPVPAALPEFQLRDGSLAALESVVPEAWDQSSNLSLRVPSAALGTKHRNLKATVQVLAGKELLELSKPLAVRFPKR